MSLNITIDHARSVHGSAHSSLSDEEEDSSGTGVQVSPPSATGSQDYPENFEDGPDGGEWAHVIYPDELHPSDSASRPRTSNHYRPPEAARGGGLRQGARRHPPHEPERRRPPPSPGSVASSDDYEAYVRGGPDRRYFPQIHSGPPPITYATAPSSSSGSYNPYLQHGIPQNQLVPIGAPGPYPYPHQYPPTSHHPGPGYIGPHPPNGPLVHQMQQQGGPPYGGSPYGGPEMYSHPSQGYFPYPQPYPMPQGMIPSQFYNPYQRIQSPAMAPTPPPQPAAAHPPPAADPVKDEGMARLEQLLMEQKLFQEKREAAFEKAAAEKIALEERAIRDKEIATTAAKNAAASAKAEAEEKAKEDVAKAREEAATKAAADAKTEAEAKAAEDMAKAKEEAEKQAKEAKEQADAAMKKAVAEAAAKPPAEKKKPIKFKDAVGRKFSFPFHLCCTWVGMEELIRQAFLHVEVIGPHVADGHYDLVGPNGEIILPQVWETMVEPDWTITMHMWPMPEPPPPDPDPPPPDDLLPQVMILDPKKLEEPGAPPIFVMDGGPPPPPPAPLPPHSGPSVHIIDPDRPGKKPQRPQKIPSSIGWMAGRSKSTKSLKAEKRTENAAQHDTGCRVM